MDGRIAFVKVRNYADEEPDNIHNFFPIGCITPGQRYLNELSYLGTYRPLQSLAAFTLAY